MTIRSMLLTTAHVSRRIAGLFSVATVTTLIGLVLMTYGLHAIYAPLAWIILGAGLLIGGLWLAGLSLPQRRRER